MNETTVTKSESEILTETHHDHGSAGHVHGPNCSHGHHHHVAPFQRSAPKVGRNDDCPCGSGKKFKKCCG